MLAVKQRKARDLRRGASPWSRDRLVGVEIGLLEAHAHEAPYENQHGRHEERGHEAGSIGSRVGSTLGHRRYSGYVGVCGAEACMCRASEVPGLTKTVSQPEVVSSSGSKQKNSALPCTTQLNPAGQSGCAHEPCCRRCSSSPD
jgi:hypothetical protein